ncbi:TetR/AcrR family transcriptional regulator [Paludibacterium purpuratum]|uniref:TetR family transcriptional regulator n=1 Tax=Paludibacterium purpuratum TaxID=1144873 RepID=A0A4R7BGL5_9NEIS|nr:TetR/AcrR family transcriptional regulator [Paludibacterium purpuratum]TDR82907.1 TetR family transcriptional regulator [Paludibacterium purpuratum]
MRVKSEAKRNGIVQAAMALFLEKGFEASSMADIARRAGGSKATLYSYFPSKEALFSEVMDQHCAARFACAFDNLRFDGDLSASLCAFGLSLMAALLSPDLLAIRRSIIAESGRSPVGALFYEQGPRRGLMLLSQFLQSQMQAGRLRSHDPWLAAMHLFSLLEGDYPLRALLGMMPHLEVTELSDHVQQAVALFLYAYAPNAALGAA